MVENSQTNAEKTNNEKSDDELDKLVAKFLKDALSYLEDRIKLVDNKASILIAIQGGLFALVAWVTKEVFWTKTPSIINCASYIFIAIDFIIMILTILLLVQTIRPGKWFFGLEVPIDKRQEKGYVMWFEDGFPRSMEDYRERIDSLDQGRIRANYEKAHYTTLQLVRRKYSCYRWAVVGMKVMIVFSMIGLGILTWLKLS